MKKRLIYTVPLLIFLLALWVSGCQPQAESPELPSSPASPPATTETPPSEPSAPSEPSTSPSLTEPSDEPVAPVLMLPEEQVNADHVWLSGRTSEYDLKLSGIGKGFDISNGNYPGWCLEDNMQDNMSKVILYSSYDPDLPEDIKYYRDPSLPKGALGEAIPWDKLNYLLNHKRGSRSEVGGAIFMLIWGKNLYFPTTRTTVALYEESEANGAGFVPQTGQTIAIILYQDGLGDDILPDDRDRKYQDTIIEFPLP
jgi:hypothetical protein